MNKIRPPDDRVKSIPGLENSKVRGRRENRRELSVRSAWGQFPQSPQGLCHPSRSLSEDDLSSRDAKTWRLYGVLNASAPPLLPPRLCASLTSCSSTSSSCSLALFTGFSSAYKRDHALPAPEELPSVVPSPSAACISPSLAVFLREHPGLAVFFSLQPGFRSCRVVAAALIKARAD
nr:unnamed protein product [Rangifer tarandus platyrhynchus]